MLVRSFGTTFGGIMGIATAGLVIVGVPIGAGIIAWRCHVNSKKPRPFGKY